MTQIGFESLAYSDKQRRTGRETVSAEMGGVLAWRQLLDRTAPHYPKPGRRRRPYPVALRL